MSGLSTQFTNPNTVNFVAPVRPRGTTPLTQPEAGSSPVGPPTDISSSEENPTHHVRSFQDTPLDPTGVSFQTPQTTPPLRNYTAIAKAHFGDQPPTETSTRALFEKALTRAGLPEDQATRATLAKDLGFRDYAQMVRDLSKCTPEALAALAEEMTLPGALKPGSEGVPFSATGLNQRLATQLQAEIRQTLPNVQFGPTNVADWPASALLSYQQGIQQIARGSSKDLERIQKMPNLSLNFEPTPTTPDAPKDPTTYTAVQRMNDAMWIANTQRQHGSSAIFIRQGATQADPHAILGREIAQKLGIMNRDVSDHPRAGSLGSQWYRQEELQDRQLLDPSGKVDRTRAQSLLQSLTKINDAQGNLNGGATARSQFSAVAMATLRFGSQATQNRLLQDPILKEYLTTNKSGFPCLDIPKLDHLYHKSTAPEQAQVMESLNKLVQELPDNVLTNTVFHAEQQKETRGLQDFLTQTGDNKLRRDGVAGANTQKAVRDLQSMMLVRLIEHELKGTALEGLIDQSNRNGVASAADKASRLVQAIQNPGVRAGLAASASMVPGGAVLGLAMQAAAGGAALLPAETRARIEHYSNMINGRFDAQTSQDLVQAWLDVVDADGDRSVAAGLVVHELGHNIQDTLGQEDPYLQVDYNWEILGQWPDKAGNDSSGYMMHPATRSLGRQEAEEVSDYGETNSYEDFAESYRLMMGDPKALFERSPSKFLFLNSFSQRFTNQEILQQFATDDNKRAALGSALQTFLGQHQVSRQFTPEMFSHLTNQYRELYQQPGLLPATPPPAPTHANQRSQRTPSTSPAEQAMQTLSQQRDQFRTLLQETDETQRQAQFKALVGAQLHAQLPPSLIAMATGSPPDPALKLWAETPNLPLPPIWKNNLAERLRTDTVGKAIGDVWETMSMYLGMSTPSQAHADQHVLTETYNLLREAVEKFNHSRSSGKLEIPSEKQYQQILEQQGKKPGANLDQDLQGTLVEWLQTSRGADNSG